MDTYVGLEPRAPFLLFSVGTGVTMPVQPSTRQYSRVPTGGTNTGTWEKIDLPPNIDEWLGLRGSGIEKFWFETLWILPLVVDVGIISEETSVPVFKYNSKRHSPMLISSIENLVDPDTWLDDIPETPYFMPSQTRLPFFVVVSEEGSVTLDGYFLFTTPDGQYRLSVVGQRMVIWWPPPPPLNWPPYARFSATWYTATMRATFTDMSFDVDGTIVSRFWTFGDGAESAEQHPVHDYAVIGTYTVTLTVTDNAGATNTASLELVFRDAGDPDIEPVSGTIRVYPRGLGVRIIPDATWTIEGPNEFTFDGTGEKILLDMEEGEYTVTWHEYGDFGPPPAPTVRTKTDRYLRIHGYYVVGFVNVRAERASDGALMSQVQHRVTGPGGFDEFYDGVHLNLTTPVGYAGCAAGIYTVTWLPLENWVLPEPVTEEKELTLGGNILFTGVYTWDPPPEVDPGEPYVNFIWTVDGLTVVFIDASYDPLGELVSWDWDFGDGATSGEQSPTHTYEDGGLFTVTLTVENDADVSDTVTKNVRVRVPPPPLPPRPKDEDEILTPETPIVEVLEWKTDIVANVYGEEQRIGVRRFPRQYIRYEYLARDSHARRSLVSLLHGWQGKGYLLPVWPDAHYPAGPIVATGPDQDIPVDTSWGGFRVGSMVFITDGYNGEPALIKAIHSDRLETTPLNRNYPSSAMIMPCRSVRLTDSQSLSRHPRDLEKYDLMFHVLDNDTGMFGYGTGLALFNGRVVLDGQNLLTGETLGEGVFIKEQVLDTGVGVPWIWSFWEQSRVATKKTWLCRTRKEAWEIRRLLYYLHGSRRTFYVPTFYPDLSVQRTIVEGVPHMHIQPINYHRYLKGNEPLNAIQVLLQNGTRLNFLVTDSESVVFSGVSFERLHLDPAPAYDIEPEDIQMVSFMRLCRIADDVSKLTHHASGETVIEVNLIGVQG